MAVGIRVTGDDRLRTARLRQHEPWFPEAFVALEATRAALAAFERPVLLLGGEVDQAAPPRAVTELAGLFPGAELVIQAGAGHFPWLDDADVFRRSTATFLR